MKLLNKRLSNLEKETDKKAIIPPEALRPYLEEKKGISDEQEALECNLLLDAWRQDIGKAVKRSGISLDEVLTACPEPFRGKVIKHLRKNLVACRNEPTAEASNLKD